MKPAITAWLSVCVILGLTALLTLRMVESEDLENARLVTGIASGLAKVLILLLTVKFVWGLPDDRRVFGPMARGGWAVTFAAVAVLWLFWYLNAGRTAGPRFGASAIEAAWVFFSAAVLSPVAEEWLCRGLFLQRFRLVVSTRMAVLIQAMLWATLHPKSHYLAIYFVVGTVLGAIRVQAGVLWPCMFLHCGWNGCLALTAYGYL